MRFGIGRNSKLWSAAFLSIKSLNDETTVDDDVATPWLKIAYEREKMEDKNSILSIDVIYLEINIDRCRLWRCLWWNSS